MPAYETPQLPGEPPTPLYYEAPQPSRRVWTPRRHRSQTLPADLLRSRGYPYRMSQARGRMFRSRQAASSVSRSRQRTLQAGSRLIRSRQRKSLIVYPVKASNGTDVRAVLKYQRDEAKSGAKHVKDSMGSPFYRREKKMHGQGH